MLDAQVSHPVYGAGVVVGQPRYSGEAPIEWQKVWDAVVLVQFPKYEARSGRSCIEAWVFIDDLSVACNKKLTDV